MRERWKKLTAFELWKKQINKTKMCLGTAEAIINKCDENPKYAHLWINNIIIEEKKSIPFHK